MIKQKNKYESQNASTDEQKRRKTIMFIRSNPKKLCRIFTVTIKLLTVGTWEITVRSNCDLAKIKHVATIVHRFQIWVKVLLDQTKIKYTRPEALGV